MSSPIPESPSAPPTPLTQDDRTWAMLAHLSGLCKYAVPLGNIIVPLVIWLVKKDQSSFVDDQGKEALNFQLSITIYGVVAAVLIFAIVGFALLPAVLIFDVVMLIVAAVKANQGEYYRYPLTIRFVS